MIQNRGELQSSRAHKIALDCIEAGVLAATPKHVFQRSLSVEQGVLFVEDTAYNLDEYSKVIVVGGGNAAGRAAWALEKMLGDRIAAGAIVTDLPTDTDTIEIYSGSHPLPNEEAVEGTTRVLELVQAADKDTLVLSIVTGGGSALLSTPVDDVSLPDLRETTEKLLSSGATIHEMNAVRKHLSMIKGGKLVLEALPATTVGLLMSDVAGNDLDVIASGPTTPDTSTFEDALAVVDNYDIELPYSVRSHLEGGASGVVPDTPSPDDERFDGVKNHVLVDGMTALDAAADVVTEYGYSPLVLSSRVRGEAREVAKVHLSIAEEMVQTNTPIETPAVLISGGETTVTLQGDGVGGPNQEFALSTAIELTDDSIVVASVDTDGIDGVTDVAGALIDSATISNVQEARTALRENDVYPLLERRNSLIRTGPTGTNVNDLRVFVVD